MAAKTLHGVLNGPVVLGAASPSVFSSSSSWASAANHSSQAASGDSWLVSHEAAGEYWPGQSSKWFPAERFFFCSCLVSRRCAGWLVRNINKDCQQFLFLYQFLQWCQHLHHSHSTHHLSHQFKGPIQFHLLKECYPLQEYLSPPLLSPSLPCSMPCSSITCLARTPCLPPPPLPMTPDYTWGREELLNQRKDLFASFVTESLQSLTM